MSSRTILLTGASDGIGAAAARRLARRGDRLLLVGRSPDKLAAVAQPLGAEHRVADYARLDSVRELAEWVLTRVDRLDVLANNAGGFFGERSITIDGNERTMQVNHYAPFLLTHLLVDLLRESRATVVTTASVGGRMLGRIDLDDLDNARNSRAMRTYGDSKLANILFTDGLHARYHSEGVAAVAIHPGNIRSSLGSEASGWMRAIRGPMSRLQSPPERGADMLLWAIDGSAGTTWQSGEYYEGRRIPRRPNPQQGDRELIDRLWAESLARTTSSPKA